MSGFHQNELDPLVLPLLQTDNRLIGRGTQTYRSLVNNPMQPVPVLMGMTDSNSTPRAQISDDPLTWWEPVDMPVYLNGSPSNWYDAVYAPELKTLFAVAGLNGGSAKNAIGASRDGRRWAGRGQDDTAIHKGIAWAPSIPLLCICGEAGSTTSNRIRTSPDGIIWTERALPTINQTLRCIAWSPTLGRFVTMGTSNAVFTSSDGVNWTSRTGPTGSNNSWRRVIWCGGTLNKFVAFDGNNTATSSDGITWAAAVGASMPGNGQGLAYDPVGNILVISDANSNSTINHSSNGGVTWNTHTVGSSAVWQDVVWSPLLGKFISVGTRSIAHSTNGSAWTVITQSAIAVSMAFTRLIATQ
jgi:hypothetical protein